MDSLANLASDPNAQLQTWGDNVASVADADAWQAVGENAGEVAEEAGQVASIVVEEVEEITDALGITNLTQEELVDLQDDINNGLPSELAAINVKSDQQAAQFEQEAQQQLATQLFGEDVQLTDTVTVVDANGESVSISYGEVIADFSSRGVDALHNFVAILDSADLANVSNIGTVVEAKDTAKLWLDRYNNNSVLYDALENYASGQLVIKMVAAGVTNIVQATGVLKSTAETAGTLQGEAIETLRKLKSGLGDLLSPGSTDKGIKNNNSAGNTEDLIAKDVKENVGEVNVNGEVDFYTKIDQAGFDIKVDVNAQPIELKLSNGVRIQAEAGKTTTVLGKYQYIDGSGTGEVLELTNYPGTYDCSGQLQPDTFFKDVS